MGEHYYYCTLSCEPSIQKGWLLAEGTVYGWTLLLLYPQL
jgi:hypothetical protein